MMASLRARLPWPLGTRRPPLVPVLRLAGAIGGGGMLRGAGINLAGLERPIETAFAFRRAPLVALLINSPGGSPTQAALIARRIRRLADEKQRKVVAFIEDVGASGGYWLALAGDEIYVSDCSIVGSIGVITAGFGLDGALERLGVQRRLHTTGPRKAMLDPFRPEDPEDVRTLRAIQDHILDAFKAELRARRGERLRMPEEELYSGRVWSGPAAVEGGLVDGLGDMHGVLRERLGSRVRFRVVNAPRGWLWQRRFSGDSSAPRADPAALVDLALARLEERALFARFGL
jgi:signal peptide peptidase SppA